LRDIKTVEITFPPKITQKKLFLQDLENLRVFDLWLKRENSEKWGITSSKRAGEFHVMMVSSFYDADDGFFYD